MDHKRPVRSAPGHQSQIGALAARSALGRPTSTSGAGNAWLSAHRAVARAARAYCVWRTTMGSAWLTRYLRLLFPDEELVVNTRRGFRMAASPHGYMSHRI